MTLPECKSWKLGRYTVHQALRPDNPLFSRFVIMRGGRVVGYSFSVPDADQCESIERIEKSGRYVEKSAAPKNYSYRLPEENAASARKGGRSIRLRKILETLG